MDDGSSPARAAWRRLSCLRRSPPPGGYGPWSAPVSAELPDGSRALNTAVLEGCPSVAPDNRQLFFASNRPGGVGGIDLYVAERKQAGDPWGDPVNLGPPVNTTADEFCPTPLRDGLGLLFVSTRSGGCGGSDIYVSRERPRHGWAEPVNPGCSLNSAGNEASPFLVSAGAHAVLYFSSTRGGGFASDPLGTVSSDADIYSSAVSADGSFGAPALVPMLNTAATDARPNVRRDGREIFFDSNRAGGSGGLDLWSATRESTAADWSAPENLGPKVNGPAGEARPSLSWDGTTLYFGSTRAGGEGDSDLYVTTRERSND